MSLSLDGEALRRLDASGMEALIRSWPEQIAAQRRSLAEANWPGALAMPAHLAVGGLGGSAIGADLARGIVEDALPVPYTIVRDYEWPASVDGRTLCVVCSYSGNTEESLALYDDAGARGARRLGITSGGALAERAQRDGVPRAAMPGGLPPRAALGYSLVSLLAILRALGCPGTAESDLDEATRVLAAGNERLAPETPEEQNPAKRMARDLAGRVAVVYGTSRFWDGVGRRWKGQINENAKMPAFHAAFPELNHNETVGWEALRPLHDRFAVVMLRDPEEAPRTARRFEVTRRLLEEEGVTVREAHAAPGGRLARLLSLVQFGDWVSLYLAVLAGVDPTPIRKIETLKRALEGAT
jgi:glucose/mannose-6-phosphate isomerase